MFPKFEYSGLDGQLETAAKIIQASLKFYIKIISYALIILHLRKIFRWDCPL